MYTNIDWAGTMFLALIAILALIVGWIGGMLHMRANYLGLLKAERVEKKRMTRWAEKRARDERYLGYAVGYREGSRAYPNGMERE